MIKKLRPLSTALAVAALCASGLVQAQQSRGVNPADIDSRFDVIYKRVNIDPEGSLDVWTLKYDYKLTNNWGLNFELPVASKLKTPGFSASGNGDFFARARYIVPAGPWIYGLSFETVLDTASKDALGTGRNQLNFAALAVRPWSPGFISAFAAKRITALGSDGGSPKFNNTEVRFIPVFILPDGWAITGEVRQTWEHRGTSAQEKSWRRYEATLNKQFNLQWAGSVSYSTDTGDNKDDGTYSLAVKYFF